MFSVSDLTAGHRPRHGLCAVTAQPLAQLDATVAAVLRAGIRTGDCVGRYGGDEFIVLLPDTNLDAACALAERLRAKICTTTKENGYEAPWWAGTMSRPGHRGGRVADVAVAWHQGIRPARCLVFCLLRGGATVKRAGGDSRP